MYILRTKFLWEKTVVMDVEIPGYKIVKTLGKGGMATVYLAIQEIFEREVALKVMAPELASDPSFGKRFMREARIVSQLVHPNIVTVFDVGVHNNLYYLSMEYISGPDLKSGRGALTLAHKIAILADVARALDFAAGKGYIHRDIKPENIILREKSIHAVLMDFGIARAADMDASVTQTGTALGTPHYMSPEQAKGAPVDHRTDLYSLGVVFYFLLVGSVPYHADSAVAIGIKHITEPVPKLPQALQVLQPFIDGLMAKEPNDRFSSAAELLEHIQAIDLVALAEHERHLSSVAVGYGDGGSLGNDNETLLHGALTDSDVVAAERAAQALGVASGAGFIANRGRPFWGLVGALVGLVIVSVVMLYTWREEDEYNVATVNRVVVPAPVAEETAVSTRGVDDRHPKAMSLLQKFNDGVQNLSGRLNKNLPTADFESFTASAQDLRQKIHQDFNAEANQRRLDQLAGEAFQSVNELIQSGQFDMGIAAFTEFKSTFPEYWRQQHDLVDLIKKTPQLKALYQSAQTCLADGKVIAPEQDNVLFYLQSMQELQPDLEVVRKGFEQVVKVLEEQAIESYNQGSWGRAYSYAKQLLELDQSNSAAKEMVTTIEAYQIEENQVTEWLAVAQGHFAAGHYYSPSAQSAFAFYQKVLAVRADQPAALAGIKQVELAFEQRIEHMLTNGDIEFADTELALAQAVNPNNAAILELQNRLRQYSQKQNYSGGPVIDRLVVSQAPITDFGQLQAKKVSAYKTLYGAITYKGFDGGEHIVYASLTDRHNKQVDRVAIVLSARVGETRFRIDHVNRAFAKGRYTLTLHMDDVALAAVDFYIEDQ